MPRSPLERSAFPLRLSEEPLGLVEALRAGWASGGEEGYQRAKLAAVERGSGLFGSPPGVAAAILTSLGQHEAAIDCLTAACDARVSGLVLIGADTCFRPLRGQPRFEALLARIGLPLSGSVL